MKNYFFIGFTIVYLILQNFVFVDFFNSDFNIISNINFSDLIRFVDFLITFFLCFGIMGFVSSGVEFFSKKFSTSPVSKIIIGAITKFLNIAKYVISLYIAIKLAHFLESYSLKVNLFFKASFIFIATYVSSFIVSSVFKLLLKSKKEDKLAKQIFPILSKFIVAIIWVIGILTILGNLGYNISALIAGAGIGGITVALAAQKTVANIFGAISIILNKPFQVGDSVTIGGVTGTVEEIGMTYLKITNTSGNKVLIPNESIISSTIENLTVRKNRKIDFSIGLVYETSLENLKKGVQIVEKILEKRKKDETIDSYRVNFDSFGDSALIINITYFSLINDDFAKFLNQKGEINYEIKSEFEKAGLEMAFNTQEIRLKNYEIQKS